MTEIKLSSYGLYGSQGLSPGSHMVFSVSEQNLYCCLTKNYDWNLTPAIFEFDFNNLHMFIQCYGL